MTEKVGRLRRKATSCSGRTQPRTEQNKIDFVSMHVEIAFTVLTTWYMKGNKPESEQYKTDSMLCGQEQEELNNIP